MIKLFFKLIGFLIMVLAISTLTIIFVPDEIANSIKDLSNSAWQQITSSQQAELPESTNS